MSKPTLRQTLIGQLRAALAQCENPNCDSVTIELGSYETNTYPTELEFTFEDEM